MAYLFQGSGEKHVLPEKSGSDARSQHSRGTTEWDSGHKSGEITIKQPFTTEEREMNFKFKFDLQSF